MRVAALGVRLVGAARDTGRAGRPHRSFTSGARARQVRRLLKVDADHGLVDAAEDAEVDCPAAVKRMVPLRAHGAGLEPELQPQVDHL